MTPNQVIERILLGGLLGLLGQGIRMAIGLKKLSDVNARRENKEELNTGRLMVSLFIGFVAGSIYVLLDGTDSTSAEHYVGNQFIFTVIAAGYAGGDFIEGLFGTYMTKMPGTNNSNSNAVVTVNPDAETTVNEDTVGMPVPKAGAINNEPSEDVPDTGANPT